MIETNLQKVFYAHEYGKDKIFINGEWLAGEWIEEPIYKGYCSSRIENKIDEPAEYISDSKSEYTGINTEKDTIKIFQNDIVKFDDGNICFTGRVGKRHEEWGIIANRSIPLPYAHRYNFIGFWEIVRNTGDYDRMFEFMTNPTAVVPYVEVIGNIYNPELLKN